MNKVALVGRLTRDPEIRYTSNDQMAITRFTVAVDRRFKRDGQPSADFIGCVAFGKIAELVSRYCKKGYMVSVAGRIQTGSYDNKEGKKVYTTDIVAEEVTFLDRGSQGQGGQGGGRPGGDYSGNMSGDSGYGYPEDFQPSEDNDDLPF